MLRMLGLFALIPVTLLLTLSFFVLFAVQKTEKGGIRTFGWVLAILLWVVAALPLSGGIFVLATGNGPWCMKMRPCGPSPCPPAYSESQTTPAAPSLVPPTPPELVAPPKAKK
jgi:hypothetical protein